MPLTLYEREQEAEAQRLRDERHRSLDARVTRIETMAVMQLLATLSAIAVEFLRPK